MNKVAVVGLPRSGTSMMMRVLELGGVKCEYDSTPEDRKKMLRNPYGCFEKIKPQFSGCVKCFAPRLVAMIPENWKIIYIDRNVKSRIQSWENVKKGNLVHSRKPYEIKLKRQMRIEERLKSSVKGRDVLFVDYDKFVNCPEQYSKEFQELLGDEFNFNDAIRGIDKNLWINRNKGEIILW